MLLNPTSCVKKLSRFLTFRATIENYLIDLQQEVKNNDSKIRHPTMTFQI